MEKSKCEKNFTFVKYEQMFAFYVITDDLGGKSEKKW